MEHQLARIAGKHSDYCVCKNCGVLNWYENENCWNCGASEEDLDCSFDVVDKWIDDEYEYWTQQEGYSEEEADYVYVRIS